MSATTPRLLCAALVLVACTVEQLGPDSVDPGADFSITEIVFDEGYFYCRVEPILFAQKCGPGDSGSGDTSGGCHFNVTTFRLSDYPAPRVSESCGGGVVPSATPPSEARANYQRAQANMDIDPALAPLLIRPTAVAEHPRRIFEGGSPEAQAIRDWATKFSSQ